MSKAMEVLAKLVMEMEKQSELYEADQATTQIKPKLEADKPSKKDIEKKAEELKPLSPDEPSKEIKPKLEDGAKSDAPDAKKGDEKGTGGELKPKDATEQAAISVKVNDTGNKPLESKSASEVDNIRKELKPLEATEAASVKVKSEESGNAPVKSETPGEQKKVEEPAEKKSALLKIASALIKLAGKEVTGGGRLYDSGRSSQWYPDSVSDRAADIKDIAGQFSQGGMPSADSLNTSSLSARGLGNAIARQLVRAGSQQRFGTSGNPASVYNPIQSYLKGPSSKPPVSAGIPMEKKQSFIGAIKKAMLLQKIAKVLSPDDKPVNAPKAINAEGSEAATLTGDDSRKATQEAGDAVGKATSQFTMHRSQEKGTDPSMIKSERGSRREFGRDQDSKKIASINEYVTVDREPPRGPVLGTTSPFKDESETKNLLKAMAAMGIPGSAIGAVLGAIRRPDLEKGRTRLSNIGYGAAQGGALGAGIPLFGAAMREALDKSSAYKLGRAVSQKQQKFMGMVHAVQKGDMPAPSGEVAEVAKEMKPGDVTDYAETKRKGLPEKKTEKKAAAINPELLARLGQLIKGTAGAVGRFGVDTVKSIPGQFKQKPVASMAKVLGASAIPLASKVKLEDVKRIPDAITSAMPTGAERSAIGRDIRDLGARLGSEVGLGAEAATDSIADLVAHVKSKFIPAQAAGSFGPALGTGAGLGVAGLGTAGIYNLLKSKPKEDKTEKKSAFIGPGAAAQVVKLLTAGGQAGMKEMPNLGRAGGMGILGGLGANKAIRSMSPTTAINPPDAAGIRARRTRLAGESAAADSAAQKQLMKDLGLAAAGIGGAGLGAYGLTKLLQRKPKEEKEQPTEALAQV